MRFFIVTMAHPEGDGWNRQLADHVRYLHELVASGVLRASGPLKGTPLRSGFLIFTAPDRAAVEALVACDPFAIEGLIKTLTIVEWDPLFGAFAAESSGHLEGLVNLLDSQKILPGHSGKAVHRGHIHRDAEPRPKGDA